MHAYEASTTVGGQGEIHLAGVPFQPGVEVNVVVSPKEPEASSETDSRQRIKALFSALDRARNDQPIGLSLRER